jgi:hypothetical protein
MGHSLERPARYQVQTQPRRRPDSVKEALVVERAFENQGLVSEDVAEFAYRPTACRKTYRMGVVRKNRSVAKGERWRSMTSVIASTSPMAAAARRR